MRSTVLTSLGLILGAFAGALTPTPTKASQLAAVCTTDEQTLASIKADSDQTLWTFMQGVCRGVYKISASRPPTVAAPIGHLKTEVPPQVAIHTPIKSALEAVEIESLSPKGGDSTLPAKMAMGASKSQEQLATVSVGDTSSENHQLFREMKNTPTSRDEPSTSLLYSLLMDITPSSYAADLPEPLSYKPGVLSRYKPNYFTDVSASNHGRGYLRPPSVASVVPFGFYAGTSLSVSRSQSQTTRSALPSLILGYSDERAIRDPSNFTGSGFRVEFEIERDKPRGQREYNSYGVSGELYQPIGGGRFIGIGAGVGQARSIPMANQGAYDSEGWSIYVPLGLGFTNSFGHSGKIQFNAFLRAKTQAKFSQLTPAGNFSDPTVNYKLGDAFSIDYNYSYNTRTEVFAKYERVISSDQYSYRSGSTTVTDRASSSWSFGTGLRVHF